MKRVLLLTVVLMVYLSAFSQGANYCTMLNEGLIGYEANGKWGFKDEQGEVMIKPQFEAIGWFPEGLCNVQIKGKWGFIDRQGIIVIQPKYGSARPFCNGYSVVVSQGLFGVINKRGEETAPLKFKYRISNFFNDTAMTQIDTAFYYINPKGEIIGEIKLDK